MADLEERRISDLTRALEVDSSALFEASFPDASAESGYSSYATDVETMAQKMLGGINFETQLQTKAKNIFGAINEANQHGGGGGGSNVIMSDNPNGGVDLDVEGTVRTLANQETIDGVVAIEQNEEVDEIDVVEPSDIADMATKSDLTDRFKRLKSIHSEITNATSHTVNLPDVYATYIVGICQEGNIHLLVGAPRATANNFSFATIVKTTTTVSTTVQYSNGKITVNAEPSSYHHFFVLELV